MLLLATFVWVQSRTKIIPDSVEYMHSRIKRGRKIRNFFYHNSRLHLESICDWESLHPSLCLYFLHNIAGYILGWIVSNWPTLTVCHDLHTGFRNEMVRPNGNNIAVMGKIWWLYSYIQEPLVYSPLLPPYYGILMEKNGQNTVDLNNAM